MDIFFRINKLPHEMVDIIYEFIPPTVKCILNNKFYKKFHCYIKPHILNAGLYDNYIRHLIRRDSEYVFYQTANENIVSWCKTKKYIHKNKSFSNYVDLLENLCLETESTKCRNIIKYMLNKSGLFKNQHKKKIVKIINREWIN